MNGVNGRRFWGDKVGELKPKNSLVKKAWKQAKEKAPVGTKAERWKQTCDLAMFHHEDAAFVVEAIRQSSTFYLQMGAGGGKSGELLLSVCKYLQTLDPALCLTLANEAHSHLEGAGDGYADLLAMAQNFLGLPSTQPVPSISTDPPIAPPPPAPPEGPTQPPAMQADTPTAPPPPVVASQSAPPPPVPSPPPPAPPLTASPSTSAKGEIPTTLGFASSNLSDSRVADLVVQPVSDFSLWPSATDLIASIGGETGGDGQIVVTSKVSYQQAHVMFKVKVQNTSPVAIAKVRVKPFVQEELFHITPEEEKIDILPPGEGQTKTFYLKPRGECGNTSIHGNVEYYDTGANEYETIKLKPKETSIVCPILRRNDVSEEIWNHQVQTLSAAEEDIQELPLAAKIIYDSTCDVLQQLNLALVARELAEEGGTQYGRGLFCAVGEIKGNHYGVSITVVGTTSESRLTIKTFAESQASLIGFHHKIIEEIGKKTKLPKHFDRGPTIFVAGNYIESQVIVKDSVMLNSSINESKSINVQDGVVVDGREVSKPLAVPAQTMKCPFCGMKSSDLVQCSNCGIGLG